MAGRRKFSKESIDRIKKLIKRAMEDEDINKVEALVKLVHEKYPDVKPSADNLYQKLGRGTLKSIEEREIADVLGYNVVWVKRK